MGGHNTRRRRSGQVLIFGAVIIMLLVFSTAIAIHISSSTYQSFHYNEAKELIGNFNDALRKALRNILINMTQEYNQTAEIAIPREHAYGNFTFWMKTAIRTLASKGVQLNFTLPPFNTTEGNLYANDLVKLYWYSPQSISRILVDYTIDIPSFGFYGWREETQLFLNVTIDTFSIKNDTDIITGGTSTTFNIIVNSEGGVPVENLKKSSFTLKYFNGSSWEIGNVTTLLNNGGGNYTIYLQTIDANPGPVPFSQYLVIWLQDTRGIIVEAYTYTHIDYTITETAIGSGTDRTYETYDFEALQNGTLVWFNRQLKFNGLGSYIPIPPTPAKQLRVNVTVNGISDSNMPLSPSQVEVWTTDYEVPLDFSPDYKVRFNESDKLVFFVNYSGATSQNATVSWSTDADALEPYPLESNKYLTYPKDNNLWIVNNSVYLIGVAFQNDTRNPIGKTWTFQVNSSDNLPNSDVEYLLFSLNISVINSTFIPWNGLLAADNWTFLQGSVRGVAYRSSQWTYCPAQLVPVPDKYYHTEIILIPYNVSYFQTYFTAKMNADTQATANYVTMFSNMSYGSAQLVDSTYNPVPVGIVNGEFSSTANKHINVNLNWNTATSFGWWQATYKNSMGQAIFYDNDTMALMKYINYSWAFTPFPAMSFSVDNMLNHVVQLELASSRYSYPYNVIYKDPSLQFKMAGWYYGGGNLTLPLVNSTAWMNGWSSSTSTGTAIPDTYYKMFFGGSCDPFISSIGT